VSFHRRRPPACFAADFARIWPILGRIKLRLNRAASRVCPLCRTKILLRPRAKKLPGPTD
jgi:hypothetical protein